MDSKNEPEQEEIRRSIFNSALQYCAEELAGIRKRLHEARVYHDYSMRYDLLMAYFVALSAKMTKTMIAEHTKWEHHITLLYNKYLIMKAKKDPIAQNFFKDFDKWEIALRRHENKLGLLTPENADPSQAIASSGGM